MFTYYRKASSPKLESGKYAGGGRPSCFFSDPFKSLFLCVLAGKVRVPASVEICSCCVAATHSLFTWPNAQPILNQFR